MATRNAATLAEIATAYAASANGDIINLTGTGTAYGYNSNAEWYSPTGTKQVTFQGQGQATTKFGFLVINSSNSTWKDLRAQTVVADPYWVDPFVRASGVTLDGLTIDTEYRTETLANNWIWPLPYRGAVLDVGGDNWTIRNCDIGRVINVKTIQVGANNATFENCLIHDCYLNNQGRNVGSGEEVHMEAMWVSGSGLTIRRCSFYRNNVYDIFFTNLNNAAMVGVTLENNVFAHSISATSEAGAATWDPSTTGVYINYLAPGSAAGTLTNWVVRNNTFETPVVTLGQNATGSRWVGNVGSWPNIPGMVYRYNVGTKIHSTDFAVSPAASTSSTTAPFGWVSPSTYDFRLTAGSVCRGKGDPSDFPAVDRAGTSRS